MTMVDFERCVLINWKKILTQRGNPCSGKKKDELVDLAAQAEGKYESLDVCNHKESKRKRHWITDNVDFYPRCNSQNGPVWGCRMMSLRNARIENMKKSTFLITWLSWLFYHCPPCLSEKSTTCHNLKRTHGLWSSEHSILPLIPSPYF